MTDKKYLEKTRDDLYREIECGKENSAFGKVGMCEEGYVIYKDGLYFTVKITAKKEDWDAMEAIAKYGEKVRDRSAKNARVNGKVRVVK